jgi:Mrp family chromosome partitioning ATPase
MTTPLERACGALERSVQSIWSTLASRRADGDGPRRILFASPRHRSGTTTLAGCTAMALCRNLRTQVALIEANPFSPALASYASCASAPGFAEVLREEAPGDEVLQEAFDPPLSLVPAGLVQSTESVDWRGPNVRLLLEEQLSDFPFAFIDAPPLLDRPVGRLLLEFADLAVLIVRAGVTTRSDLSAAQKILQDSGVPTAGVVLNRFKKPLSFR